MRFILTLIFAVLMLAPMVQDAQASPDRDFQGFPGSISSHKVNVRAGPGTNFPILWVFKMQGYPIKTTAKYGHWYKIKDAEGEEGWLHQMFVSRQETGLIRGPQPATLYKDRDGVYPLLKLEAGVLVLLKRCALGLCEVEVSGEEGWIDSKEIKRP
jgi:SH3-like domain-containing protein